jgi:hypothetical protein
VRNAYSILVAKPEAKRPLGTPRHRWENNMGTDLKELWWGMCRLDASASR